MGPSRAKVTRREALAATAVGALVAILTPKLLFADEAAVAAELKKLYGEKPFSSGKIRLDVPEIAENGLLVPISLEIESPMTDADYVKAVHVFADGNPLPRVITYRFTPACGKAAASFRMRLAQSQNIICVAEMSNSAIYMVKTQVKVTIGGCGG